MIKTVLVLTIIVILAIGGYYFFGSKSKQTLQTNPISEPTMIPTNIPIEKQYTLEEIATHDQKTDCWFAIEGKVYDVTKFIEGGKHPGGEAILQGCGKDATELFNTRPMGSGTPHSSKARENLKNFRIGALAK